MRMGLLDEPVLAACEDVRGLEILDSGCGEGNFCRILIDNGAKDVLGFDLCAPMINAARELETGTDAYRLPDFEANSREVFRVLRPGARFISANLHPMRSPVGGWHRTDNGAKQHAILDRCFDEGERRWVMMGC